MLNTVHGLLLLFFGAVIPKLMMKILVLLYKNPPVPKAIFLWYLCYNLLTCLPHGHISCVRHAPAPFDNQRIRFLQKMKYDKRVADGIIHNSDGISSSRNNGISIPIHSSNRKFIACNGASLCWYFHRYIVYIFCLYWKNHPITGNRKHFRFVKSCEELLLK